MENQLCEDDQCIDKTICMDNPIPQCVEYEERTQCLSEELVCLEAQTTCSSYYDRCVDESVECLKEAQNDEGYFHIS